MNQKAEEKGEPRSERTGRCGERITRDESEQMETKEVLEKKTHLSRRRSEFLEDRTSNGYVRSKSLEGLTPGTSETLIRTICSRFHLYHHYYRAPEVAV